MKNKIIFELMNILPVVSYRLIKKEAVITVLKPNLSFTLNVLKNHINYRYKLLSCISGVDLFHKKYRFCVSYDLLSLLFNSRIRVKVFVNEIESLPSCISIFINANWWEREIWDLYGIYFDNHFDLRRILTDYGFEGHPLRKDFPLFGYSEAVYSETKKRIVLERVQLTQEFRNFNFETPW
jgi:NADH dehydrogenase (ubiquinone) Fe-S protein 3